MADDGKLLELEQRLDGHMQQCKDQFAAGTKQFDELKSCMTANTAALNKLVDETAGVVQLHKDLQGAARIGVKAQAALAWLAKWPLVGVGIVALVKWISSQFGNPSP